MVLLKEVEAELGIDVRTLSRHLANGVIPGERVPFTDWWLVNVEVVREAVASGKIHRKRGRPYKRVSNPPDTAS